MLNPFTQLWRLITLPQQLDSLRKTIMAQIDDLNAAIAQLGTDISAEIQAVVTALQQGNPDLSAAIAQLQALDTTVKNETASLSATPAPAPAQ